MSGDILDGLIGALIGAIIGFIGGLLTLRLEYRKLFANTVSQNRMEWINNFREEFSIFVGTARNILTCNSAAPPLTPNSNKSQEILKAEQARIKLLTRLNQDISKRGNEYNQEFAEKLESIDLCNTATYNAQDIEDLIVLSRAILEPEWVKVKKEAKGEE